MQFSTVAFLSALASTALAQGSVVLSNAGSAPVYLTTTNSNQQSTQSTVQPGGSLSATISGQGNSWGVTTNSDYYSASTAKLIWGYSDSDGTLYYSVNTVDGNPFSSFTLSSTDSTCAPITAANGNTVTCGDGATFTLTVN